MKITYLITWFRTSTCSCSIPGRAHWGFLHIYSQHTAWEMIEAKVRNQGRQSWSQKPRVESEKAEIRYTQGQKPEETLPCDGQSKQKTQLATETSYRFQSNKARLGAQSYCQLRRRNKNIMLCGQALSMQTPPKTAQRGKWSAIGQAAIHKSSLCSISMSDIGNVYMESRSVSVKKSLKALDHGELCWASKLNESVIKPLPKIIHFISVEKQIVP